MGSVRRALGAYGAFECVDTDRFASSGPVGDLAETAEAAPTGGGRSGTRRRRLRSDHDAVVGAEHANDARIHHDKIKLRRRTLRVDATVARRFPMGSGVASVVRRPEVPAL